MKAYKGFDRDLKCRGFQFEVGKSYEENEAKLCESGFHACENPLDVFWYYAPSGGRYCEVELDEVSPEHGDDSKVVGKKIRIGAEIGLTGIINAGVRFILEKAESNSKKATNTGYRSAATNTGDWSAATNTGSQSVATNTGDRSAATNTGDWSAATNTGDKSVATNTGSQSVATNTGDRSAATNTGDWSAATNTGDKSVATNTGDRSAATNTGNWSAATNTGNRSAASVTGKDSIAIVTGLESKAKGALGCWIVLTERGVWNGETYPIKSVQTFYVDGKTVKADTYYVLKDGKLIEV